MKVRGLIFIPNTHHEDLGEGITKTIREWAHGNALPWMEYPYHNGMGVVKMDHRLPR